MSDAPEEIFAARDPSGAKPEWQMGWWHGQRADHRVRYVRADIAEARIAELEAANRGLVRLNEETEKRADIAEASIAELEAEVERLRARRGQ